MTIKIGQNAPDFSLITDENVEINLSELKGKYVVLYFYPKDDTPGCTIEALDFSKKFNDFEKLNCIILGISRDSVDSHCKFIKKFNLKISLLSDSDSNVCKLYDVLKEKNMFGKKSVGIDRSTFLIDKVGKIIDIWNSVKVKDHVNEVLQTLEKHIKSS